MVTKVTTRSQGSQDGHSLLGYHWLETIKRNTTTILPRVFHFSEDYYFTSPKELRSVCNTFRFRSARFGEASFIGISQDTARGPVMYVSADLPREQKTLKFVTERREPIANPREDHLRKLSAFIDPAFVFPPLR